MTIKEMIQTEIEHLDEPELRELYRLIRSFIESRRQAKKPDLLTGLAQIQIDGPPDFAANHDLYAGGEKNATSNLH